MNEILPVLLVTVAGAFLVAACSTGFSRREKKWVVGSFLMHVGFAFSQVPLALSFYGGSDMFLYFSYGELLARMMENDPLRVMPEVTALLLQRPYRLELMVAGAGTATGSMSAVAAWCFYLLGPSKYAVCIAFAVLSLCGKLAMYRAFRANVDLTHRLPAAVATLFLPSFVFWSSGLIKEALAVAGFGWSLLGLHLWIRKGRTGAGWALVVAGAVPVLLFKAYILFPLALAGGAWYYWSRSMRRGRVRIRPAYMAIAMLLALGGIVVLGDYFPSYSVDSFGLQASELQRAGRSLRGGSNYALAGEAPTTFAGQFVYAPAALFTSLFRPVIFEVHNSLMLANAVETTLLTLLFVRVLFRRNLGVVRQQLANDPFLIFCLVFVVAFGIAVGLASTNLGTLSRYRSPLVPFFAVLLIVLGKPASAWSPAREARGGTETVLRAT
jgi:hypothetical protein